MGEAIGARSIDLEWVQVGEIWRDVIEVCDVMCSCDISSGASHGAGGARGPGGEDQIPGRGGAAGRGSEAQAKHGWPWLAFTVGLHMACHVGCEVAPLRWFGHQW